MAKVEQMQAHVRHLLEDHKLTNGAHSRGGRAWRHGRHVDFRDVKTEITYAVALHEIGHVVGKGQSVPRLESEANAWVWALQNGLPGTRGPAFLRTMRKSLLSYLRWACRRNRWDLQQTVDGFWVVDVSGPVRPGAPALPSGDHVFWKLIGGEPDQPPEGSAA